MKAIILAGGFGTRISEESAIRPKPLVEIGQKPIIWHIMKLFAHHGIDDFVICCGYKGELIKQYFLDYRNLSTDFTISVGDGKIVTHGSSGDRWNVTLIDTGLNTMTGGRIKRVREFLGGERFVLTYGDGVSDIDIGKLVAFHEEHKVMATVTAVRQPGRFGAMSLSHDGASLVSGFREKALDDGGYINGGFFVLEPGVIDLIEGDDTVWENEPMDALVELGQLAAYRHDGYWQNMDTLRDKAILEKLWEGGSPPWRVWA